MVAGTERAHLTPLPVLGVVGYVIGNGTRNAAPLLRAFEIVSFAPASLHRPAGTALQHRIHLGIG